MTGRAWVWAAEAPSAPGWYWLKEHDMEPMCVRVREFGGRLPAAGDASAGACVRRRRGLSDRNARPRANVR